MTFTTSAPRFTSPDAHTGEHAAEPRAVGAMSAIEQVISDSIDAVVGIDNVIAMLHAQRAAALHQAVLFNDLRDGEPGPGSSLRLRSLRAELACAVGIPERTAERQLAEAQILLTTLPSTYEALSTAEISERHVRVLIDQTT